MNQHPEHPWAILLAAGSGTRLAEASDGVRKQYLELDGVPLFWKSVLTFSRVAPMRGIVFVFPPEDVDEMRAQVEGFYKEQNPGLPFRVVAGGKRRQDSVRNGLAVLPGECDAVLVHDSARPFVSAPVIVGLLDALKAGAKGVIPAIEVTDTIKEVSGSTVTNTLNRGTLRAVQTPQAFEREILDEAHRRAVAEDWEVTDDASMVERLAEVAIIPGEETNVKITTPEDLKHLKREAVQIPCVGWGYDVHRFGGNRPFVLGGVPIQGGPDIVAHSDGDVLLHALMDAMLGCFSGGDIGKLFPDTDPAYDGLSSTIMVKEVLTLSRKHGVRIMNVDLTAICQTPKLAPHAKAIKKNVANMLEMDAAQVNFKATTEEKLGFTGEKKGIKAVATVTAIREL